MSIVVIYWALLTPAFALMGACGLRLLAYTYKSIVTLPVSETGYAGMDLTTKQKTIKGMRSLERLLTKIGGWIEKPLRKALFLVAYLFVNDEVGTAPRKSGAIFSGLAIGGVASLLFTTYIGAYLVQLTGAFAGENLLVSAGVTSALAVGAYAVAGKRWTHMRGVTRTLLPKTLPVVALSAIVVYLATKWIASNHVNSLGMTGALALWVFAAVVWVLVANAVSNIFAHNGLKWTMKKSSLEGRRQQVDFRPFVACIAYTFAVHFLMVHFFW